MTTEPAHPEHAIRCPWCKAEPGERCTSPRGRRIRIVSHDARITAWTTRRRPTTPQEHPA
ncbi:zinc finger domain-containing protein [Streptomyces mobaraensis]|uniref:DNA-binding phage zinc finger domain-containing protein n=1 Tax=Streptomyces mobaraensis TaxID=35621 RepID=A0A5N5WDC5_STRMB|nr:hypothetical protein [Streptomyces mobaraensis]KAB7850174.1 hypothetical protein FRZ00_06135 [Streptomyces mobaraensis]